jgi:hypothetical protein
LRKNNQYERIRLFNMVGGTGQWKVGWDNWAKNASRATGGGDGPIARDRSGYFTKTLTIILTIKSMRGIISV